jgi:uncharacterized protein (DUF427 family)
MRNPAPGFEKHPNYRVDITPLAGTLIVKAGTRIIAESEDAVAVTETRHRPVWYVPVADLAPEAIRATATETYCPFKGNASYWSALTNSGEEITDAIWAYLAPYDECAAIANYASFYTDKLDLFIDGELVNKDGPGWTDP